MCTNGGLAQLDVRVLLMHKVAGSITEFSMVVDMTSWPSDIRRYVQVAVLVGVGSNPTDLIILHLQLPEIYTINGQ